MDIDQYDNDKIDRKRYVSSQEYKNWRERKHGKDIPRELLRKLTDGKRLIQAENVVT